MEILAIDGELKIVEIVSIQKIHEFDSIEEILQKISECERKLGEVDDRLSALPIKQCPKNCDDFTRELYENYNNDSLGYKSLLDDRLYLQNYLNALKKI